MWRLCAGAMLICRAILRNLSRWSERLTTAEGIGRKGYGGSETAEGMRRKVGFRPDVPAVSLPPYPFRRIPSEVSLPPHPFRSIPSEVSLPPHPFRRIPQYSSRPKQPEQQLNESSPPA